MTPAAGAMAWFWQAWLATIVFIFPIPHTIALRNLLLLIGLLTLLAILRRTVRPLPPPSLKLAAWGLVATTTWLVLHSITVAPAPTLALDNLRGDWIAPLLTAALAIWAATQLPRARAAQAVTLALAAHMMWLLGWQFHLWLVAGAWPFKATPFAAYDYQGTLNSFFLSLLVADRLAWVLEEYSPLALGQRFGWALLLLSLVSDIALQSRNSTTITVLLLLAAGLALLRASSRQWRVIAIATGMIVMVGSGSLSFDSRWQGLRESTAVGWSSPSLYWLTNDAATRPVTPSGAELEESAYLRTAWAHQALQAIGEHPLGLGFGRDGFGRAIAEKYNYPGMVSSHSGWLDFALGAGLPGLALLLITAGLAIRGGWMSFRQHGDGGGLMLGFLVGGYLLRCLLDGHLSGWRLGLFAFIVGVLIAGMKNPRTEP
jgi:hypothetical protein